MTALYIFAGYWVTCVLAVGGIFAASGRRDRRRHRRLVEADRAGCELERRFGLIDGRLAYQAGEPVPAIPSLPPRLNPDDSMDHLCRVLTARAQCAHESGAYAGWHEACWASLRADLDALPSVLA